MNHNLVPWPIGRYNKEQGLKLERMVKVGETIPKEYFVAALTVLHSKHRPPSLGASPLVAQRGGKVPTGGS